MAQALGMAVNEQQTDWDVQLPHVYAAYNNYISVNAASGLVPNEVMMSRLPLSTTHGLRAPEHLFVCLFFSRLICCTGIVFALLLELPPFHTSDPGPYSMHFFPATYDGARIRFYRDKSSECSSLVGSRRIVLTRAATEYLVGDTRYVTRSQLL